MANIEQVLVPDIGDFEEVDIVEVVVGPGDRVKPEDPLITLESDKATMDVPSPLAGKVVEVKVKTGDKVGEGAVILTLEPEAAGASGDRAEQPTQAAGAPAGRSVAPEEPEAAGAPAGRPDAPEQPEAAASSAGRSVAPEEPEAAVAPADRRAGAAADPSGAAIDDARFTKAYASPAVRRFARELGVDLGQVRGSGRKSRILKEDVRAFVKKALSERPAAAGSLALPEMPVVDYSRFGEIERQPLSRIQKISRATVHRSWLHVPHVTQHDEADISEMDAFRRAHAEEAKAQGFKLTPVAFLMKASVAALEKYPRLNSSLDPDGEHVILKKYYHLGIAVDTEQGLVVPVIRDVDQKGILELARELAEVSAQAREGKLRPDQIQGASFTITSLGGIGGTAFTPIVNAPQVAILGVSRAFMKPVWNGEEFAPRLTLPISLSYDHQIVDGALAVRFTKYFCEVLSDLRLLLL